MQRLGELKAKCNGADLMASSKSCTLTTQSYAYARVLDGRVPS